MMRKSRRLQAWERPHHRMSWPIRVRCADMNAAESRTGVFDALGADAVLQAVEAGWGLDLDGSITPYHSYVNRVYGLRDADGAHWVAKFYRPGRWTEAAILEEHAFALECAAAEIPVVAPVPDTEGETLVSIEVPGQDGQVQNYECALYPRRGGRGFEGESDEDWYRLGAITGRMHAVGRQGGATHRLACSPDGSTRGFVEQLRAADLVHPDCRREFFTIVEEGLARIAPLFSGLPLQRVHGDLHRGNLLDREDEGLLIIDFDDMMMGPAVQDLWLLLPDRVENCGRELANLLDGYRTFSPFDEHQFALVEGLRFMRIIYFLSWNALQMDDFLFRKEHPHWGSRAFWTKEVEDLREQLDHMEDSRG